MGLVVVVVAGVGVPVVGITLLLDLIGIAWIERGTRRLGLARRRRRHRLRCRISRLRHRLRNWVRRRWLMVIEGCWRHMRYFLPPYPPSVLTFFLFIILVTRAPT